MSEEIDALLLKHGTTGVKQAWFTRAEVIEIAMEALEKPTFVHRVVRWWFSAVKPARGNEKHAAK